jgi:hypothetical protein
MLGGRVRRRLLVGLVAALLAMTVAATGRAAEQRVGSEPRAQTKGAPFRVSNGPERERAASVAWNSKGTEYLVVWEDWRDVGGARAEDLYGRFFDADGTAPGGAFRISRPADIYRDQDPAVAWNAYRNECLVV